MHYAHALWLGAAPVVLRRRGLRRAGGAVARYNDRRVVSADAPRGVCSPEVCVLPRCDLPRWVLAPCIGAG